MDNKAKTVTVVYKNPTHDKSVYPNVLSIEVDYSPEWALLTKLDEPRDTVVTVWIKSDEILRIIIVEEPHGQ